MSVLAVLVSCSKEIYDVEEKGGKPWFTAGFSDASGGKTKVLLDHNQNLRHLNVLWETGDAVSVFDGPGDGRRYQADRVGISANLLPVSEGVDPKAPVYWALYPYKSDAVMSEENGQNYINTTLPAVQTAKRDSFSEHLAVAVTSSDNRNFVFKNVTSVFKANITSIFVKKIEFRGNNNETVAGPIKVNVADASYTVMGEEEKSITINPPAGDTFVPGRYYFTVLPQRFEKGFTITITMSEGEPVVRTVDGPVDVPRSTLAVGSPVGTAGNGSEREPYVMANRYDMEGLATIIADDDIDNSETTYIELSGDIDMAGCDYWEPVNNSRSAADIAKLSIEGNGHTIENFYPTSFKTGQDGKDKCQISLLGILYGRVDSLNIVGDIRDTMSTVGILAGWVGFKDGDVTLAAEVNDVHVRGVVEGRKAVGGMAGMARNATFTNCSADVQVTALGEHAGGLVARFYENVSFTDCHATGQVVGEAGVGTGGLLGYNEAVSTEKISVIRCSATGDVSGNYQVGGLIGHTKSDMCIEASYATGDISAISRSKTAGEFHAGKHVGGILGVCAGSSEVEIANCYYGPFAGEERKTITAHGCYIGGILGCNASTVAITDCQAECNIINNLTEDLQYDMHAVGGILGGSKGTSVSVGYCFPDGTISTYAYGTMTRSPETWDEWSSYADSAKEGEGGYKGGAAGGIIGYTSTLPVLTYNISWISSISCERNNIYDAPCAPIVGCLPNDSTALADNRHYFVNHQIVISDTFGEYLPLAPSQVTTKAQRDYIINSRGGSFDAVNQYCLYNREIGGNPKVPSSTAKTWKWELQKDGSGNECWNIAGDKPYLNIRPTRQ